MNTRKRSVALVLAIALVCSLVVAGFSARANAADNYVSVDALADNGTAAPGKDAVVPDANQYQYHKSGLSAFCHFGPNTFNEIEWGEHYGSKTPDEIFKLEKDFDAELLVRSLKEAGFGTLIVTAKHHDSFCIWDSAYTTYKSSESSYGSYDYDGMGGEEHGEIASYLAAKTTQEETKDISDGLMQMFVTFGEMKEMNPADETVQKQVKRLQDYITAHFYNCTPQILYGLGQMYAAGGEFTENIDKTGGVGTAEFASRAIAIYCGK